VVMKVGNLLLANCANEVKFRRLSSHFETTHLINMRPNFSAPSGPLWMLKVAVTKATLIYGCVWEDVLGRGIFSDTSVETADT
jgi:hypothetical protein